MTAARRDKCQGVYYIGTAAYVSECGMVQVGDNDWGCRLEWPPHYKCGAAVRRSACAQGSGRECLLITFPATPGKACDDAFQASACEVFAQLASVKPEECSAWCHSSDLLLSLAELPPASELAPSSGRPSSASVGASAAARGTTGSDGWHAAPPHGSMITVSLEAPSAEAITVIEATAVETLSIAEAAEAFLAAHFTGAVPGAVDAQPEGSPSPPMAAIVGAVMGGAAALLLVVLARRRFGRLALCSRTGCFGSDCGPCGQGG